MSKNGSPNAERTPNQCQLDDKLQELFRRPGLAGQPGIQAALSNAAHYCLDILEEQKRTTRRELKAKREKWSPQTDRKKRAVKSLLLREHKARIDLNIVRWAEETKDAFMQFPNALEQYRSRYLVPVLKQYGQNTDNLSDRDVAGFILGSGIRLVVDLLGKGKCYVPDSDDLGHFSAELMVHQLALFQLTEPTLSVK